MASSPSSPRRLRGGWVADLVAGLTTGIADIPDAMASALLAGGNPVSGLYAIMVGTPVGALFSSSAFMTISATSAIAITVGGALADFTGEEHARRLYTLALLVGVLLVLAGFARLGRLIRFVSHAVMVGFLSGISVIIVLSQLSDFTGYSSDYSNKVIQGVDTVLHFKQVNAQTLTIGLLTVVIIMLVDRTRLKNFSFLIGMVVGTLAALLLQWQGVPLVGDVATIPNSFPLPALPDLTLIPVLFIDACAIAVIAMVQGAGVSKAYPNPDGEYPSVSRDYIGQGAANIASSLVQGMPIGGSVSTTALNVSAGARSRWANIISGLLVVLVVLFLAPVVSLVAMPAMAALLIVAGFQSFKREEFLDVWETGLVPRLVMLATLVLTLALPLQAAVFAGIIISILAYFFTSSIEVRLVQRIPGPDGTYREAPPPTHLPSRAITLLQLNGNLFFAAANRVEELLPSPARAEYPVVILRLRPYDSVSSTFIAVLERYAANLRKANGHLMLAGVSKSVKAQFDRTGFTADVLGPENIFVATESVGIATETALQVAERWLEALPDVETDSADARNSERNGRPIPK